MPKQAKKSDDLRRKTSPDVAARLAEVVDMFPNRSAAAQVAGWSDDQIALYLKGASVPLLAVGRLANDKNVSLDWIWTGRGPKFLSEDAAPYQAGADIADRARLERDGYVLVPRLDVRLSAGFGALAQSEQIVDHVAFKETWIRERLRINPKFLLCFEATGDSMWPTIADGDILLADISDQRVLDNAVYALAFGDALVVKRLQRQRDGSVDIVSDNSIYKTEHVPANEVDSLRVLGRIRWAGGTL